MLDNTHGVCNKINNKKFFTRSVVPSLEDNSKQRFLRFIRSLLKKRPYLIDADDLEEEIHELMDEGQAKGLISNEESHMVYGVLELKDTTAASIMVPRTEISYTNINTTLEEVIKLINECGHTRIPISRSGIDDIVGILHAKDLLKLWGKDLSVRIPEDILRTPYFVPENKKIGELLRELKKKKTHIAIVTDEYGGTSGIVTLEDIIEEIVGDIMDEHDSEESFLVPLGNDSAYVDARLEIEKLGEYFGIRIPKGNYESVGGFVIYLLGRIPQENEKIAFNDLEITIKKADPRRIHKLIVRKKESEASERSDE